MAKYNFKISELLFKLLELQNKELFAIVVYAFFTGLLYLLTPLAVEEIVNVIAFGVVSQPLVTLTILLIIGYLIAGGLRITQQYASEIVQQRLLVKYAFMFSRKLQFVPASRFKERDLSYFFEIPLLQKSYGKLIVDGVNSVLQIFVGCIVLSFYHLYFFLLVVGLLIFTIFFLKWTGINGLSSSISESESKYDLADWFRSIRKNELPSDKEAEEMTKVTDEFNLNYLQERNKHFKVTIRQAIVLFVFIALANAVLLGVGGLLTLNGDITTGRLVAAEIILGLVLGATDKLTGLISPLYDLMTALIKLKHIDGLA
ncbi:MAG TPA: hypothetical protein V6C96_03905 [Vampirovibrionales bacterium]